MSRDKMPAQVTRRVSDTAAPSAATAFGAMGRTLAAPRFLLKSADLSAADRGLATHTALEHFNFAGPCDAADIAHQIQTMVERHILWPSEAASVRVDWMQWLLASEVGRLLRQNPKAVRREVSIYYPSVVAPRDRAAASASPMDRVMVRGRIDVLVVEADEMTIIDYKTDGIRLDELESRAAMYEPQMRAYREAIHRITGKPVKQVYLVFLALGKIHAM